MALSNITALIFFWVLFQHVPTLNGWVLEEVLFILGLTTIVFGTWHTFFAGASPWSVDRLIRNGEFDRLLLQPVNVLAYLAIHKLDDDGMGDLMAGIAILTYSSLALGLTWSLTNLLLLGIFLIGGLLIIFSIFLVFASVAFWTIKSRAVADILWPFLRISEYPIEIFTPVLIFAVTFILPLGFISYYPAQLFLGKGMWIEAAYLTPIVGLISLLVAYKIWNIGLKNYASTGS
jgi:ABC-2 type transport system permease protein